MSNPILIFSHNYLVGEWETIVTEQLQLLLDTKLYQASTKIHYCVFAYENKFGKTKYGTDLDRTDLSVVEWITHAQDELHDGILYLEKLKQTLSK